MPGLAWHKSPSGPKTRTILPVGTLEHSRDSDEERPAGTCRGQSESCREAGANQSPAERQVCEQAAHCHSHIWSTHSTNCEFLRLSLSSGVVMIDGTSLTQSSRTVVAGSDDRLLHPLFRYYKTNLFKGFVSIFACLESIVLFMIM